MFNYKPENIEAKNPKFSPNNSRNVVQTKHRFQKIFIALGLRIENLKKMSHYLRDFIL